MPPFNAMATRAEDRKEVEMPFPLVDQLTGHGGFCDRIHRTRDERCFDIQ